MANKKIKGLQIQIGADYQGLDTALREVEKGSKKAADEIKEINRAIKTAGDSAELWAQKQKVLTTALEESEKKLKFLEEAQEQVNKQFQDNKINEDQYRAFQREVEYARAEVKKYSEELNNADNKVKELGDTSKTTGKDVDDLGDKTEEAGKQADNAANGGFTVLKGALAELAADGIKKAAGELKDFTADVVKTGMNFEASMSSVAAISGANTAELEKLTAKAEEMGATTKFTAAESAEAFQYMAMAGWKTEDMLEGINGILSLAAASGEDLGTTSDIVTDAMTAFGLSAENAGHFADVLAAASSNANTNVSMMGETFKYVAPVAGAMGYSIEDTAEAIGLMANAGIKSTQAGTALRSIITRLSTDAGASAKKLGALGTLTEELGVQFYNADGSARDFGEVLAETRVKWQGLNAEQQTSYGKSIAGTNALSGWLALMNAAPADVGKLSGAIRECDGAASDMSTTMMDNLQGDMTKLSSAVDGMKIALAKDLNPEIRKGVQYLTANIPKIQKTLSSFFKGTISAVKTVGGYIPDIIKGVQKAKPVIIGALSAIAAYKVLEKISSAYELFNKMKKAKVAEEAAKGATSLISPLGAVALGIGAVTTAVILLTKEREKEKSISDQIADKYKKEQKAADSLKGSLRDLKDQFYESAAATDYDSKRTEELWKELDTLTDANGRVKDSDKKRAEYILGELNEALGTEYTMTGNQIEQYKKMENEIDELIAKKKASAYLDNYIAQSSEYAKIQSESRAGYEEAYTKYTQSDADVRLAIKKMSNFGLGDLFNEDGYLKAGAKHILQNNDDSVIRELYQEWETAMAERDQNSQLMSKYSASYNESVNYLSRLDDAERAYANGDYSEVKKALYDPADADRYALEYETDLSKREEAFNNLLKKTDGDFELAMRSDSQYAVNEAIGALEEIFEAGSLAGTDLGKVFSENFAGRMQELVDKGFDITKLAEWGKKSGVKVGDAFKKDFSTVVQSQLNKGYDVTALLEWARSSGLKMTDVFGENVDFKKVITEQMEGGYDIRGLLTWAEESGFKVGDEYDKEFMEQVQKGLNAFDPKTEHLVEWAKQQGISLGKIFSDNFEASSDYNRYLYDTNNLIVYGINSASEYERWKRGEYGQNGELVGKAVPRNATGGFIGVGKSGIVAEAGPELLRVMNGGVQVTPLTDTVRNTPAESGYMGGNKILQTFNIYVKEFSSAQDARTTSQELARLQRQGSFGKGLAPV